MTRTVFANGVHRERWEAESDIEALAFESHADVSRLHPKVRTYIVRITPTLADLMLETNIRNRRVSESSVSCLATAMSSNDMRLNGETVIFSSDGNLLDGQHRLRACVKSGRSFDSIVVFGISPKAFNTIDSGRARSTSDVLGMAGINSATKISSALQALMAFVENGGMMHGSCTHHGVTKVTAPIAEKLLTAHPGIADSVNAMSCNRLMRTQHGYALHYIFSLVDKGLADDFADVLANGTKDLGRPFCRLRETLINSPITTETRGICAGKAVVAFNAERSGARPKILRLGSEWPPVDGLDFERLAESVK